MRHAVRRIASTLLLTPLLALAASCGDDGSNPLAPDVDPSRDIRDAARGDGTPGFYFVAPIAPTLQSYPGTFDAGRSPVVEVCEWSGTACTAPVARYARADGTVRLEAASQLYRADWPLRGIVAGKVYRIVVSDGISPLGHADAKLATASEPPATLKAQGYVPLGNGGSLAIRFRIEQNAAPVVAITAPADGAVVLAGTPVPLTGTATDAEEGDLSGQIVWRSSKVLTPLGTGATFSASLPSGRQTLSASVTDAMGATTTTSIEVVASIVSAPATLAVPFAGTASLPITLSEPAPAGGLTLTVASSAPGTIGTSTETVVIPEGQQSANATLQGVAPGTATVTVSNPDYGSATSAVTVTAQLNVTATSVSFAQGRTGEITIELESAGNDVAAPPGGLAVTLTSADPTCAVAAPVAIPAGLVSVKATIEYGGSATTPCATKLVASATEVAGVATDEVTVSVGQAPSLSLATTRVGAGLQSSVTLTLGAPAPAGGLEVTITSGQSGVLRVASDATTAGTGTTTVTVPAGNTTATVYLQGVAGQSGAVMVSANAVGYGGGSGVQTVAGIGIDIADLSSTSTTFSSNDAFYVRVGVLNAGGTGISAYQNVHPGAGPLVVTLTSSNPAVGQLARTGETAASVTVQVAEGASTSPTTVAAGGAAFDPVGGGTTTITATAPGVTQLASASQTVTVSAPTMTLGSTRVGAGLQTSVSVGLQTAAPAGGVDVTITNSNPGALRIAGAASAVGDAGPLTLHIAAGSSSATVYLNGVEGQGGTATLTATAPGYTGITAVQTVAGLGIDIADLSSTSTTFSSNDAFYVRIGVLNAAGTGISAYQNVQPGAGALAVTLTSSNPGVGQLARTSETGASVTVQVAEGASTSPTTVAAGGVAFDAIGGGSTTITATAPGVTQLASASQTVTVSAPTITVGSPRVGGGLQSSFTVTLQTAAPGGVTVALTNSNPGIVRLATSSTAVGTTGPLALAFGPSETSKTVYVNGIAGQTGTATIAATAPGYTDASGTVTVAPIALDIADLGSTTTTLSNNDAFYVRVGALNAGGSGISAYQNVQPGAGPLVVTLTNSNGAAAQLVRTGETAQSVQVQIAEGTLNSPTTVALGGVAFDPIGSGSTTVQATAPGAVVLAGSSQAVTISAPAITISGTRVGAGLQTSVSISLGAPAPAGGLDVQVSSSSPGVLQLATDASSPASSGTVTVSIGAGSTSGTVYLRGVKGTAGSVTVTASAPGFTNGTATEVVAGIGLDFANLPSSTTAGASNTAFWVRVGVLNAAGTSISAYQNVQPGAGPLAVTISSSNVNAAQLARTAGTAQSFTLDIVEGASTTATSVASGGVALDPKAAGSTTVTATAPGATPLSSATQTVTVNP